MSSKMKKSNEVQKKRGFKNLLTAASIGTLVLRIVILLVIPYAYLMLCGLIFDRWLHMYGMTNFIFFSLIALYVVAVVLVVLCIVWFIKNKKSK